MNQNNSAHRLCNILEKAIETGSDQQDTTLVIGRAMGIEDTSDKCFMTDFFVLISDVERSILNLQNVPKKNDYINLIREIQNLLFLHNLSRDHWPIIKATIESRNFTIILDACANFIARENPLNDLSKIQAKDYLSKSEDLLKDVKESDLEHDLKTYLIRHIEDICSALRRYDIGGSEYLQKVVEESLGGISLRYSVASEKDRQNPIIKNLIILCTIISAGISTAANIKTLMPEKFTDQLLLTLAPLIQDEGTAQMTGDE
jgi:hypothetical protein